jgi:hypothetical protein
MEKTLPEVQGYLNRVYEKHFGRSDQLDVKVNSVNPNYSWEITHKSEGWLAYIPQKWANEEREADIVKNFQYIIDMHRKKAH